MCESLARALLGRPEGRAAALAAAALVVAALVGAAAAAADMAAEMGAGRDMDDEEDEEEDLSKFSRRSTSGKVVAPILPAQLGCGFFFLFTLRKKPSNK